MAQDKAFLGTQPVGKLLFRLAVPTVIAQLVNMLYNIVDRIYIGHMPEDGTLALPGVGDCLPLIILVSAFASFVASGGAPRASICMGRGDHDSAEKILGGCFTLLKYGGDPAVGAMTILSSVMQSLPCCPFRASPRGPSPSPATTTGPGTASGCGPASACC